MDAKEPAEPEEFVQEALRVAAPPPGWKILQVSLQGRGFGLHVGSH